MMQLFTQYGAVHSGHVVHMPCACACNTLIADAKPALQVTYSSDYFEQLYQLSVQLIKGGHAYVDHQTAEHVKLSRFVS